MEVNKQTQALGGGVPTAAQLAAINAQARAELKAEDVFVFSLRLCDDQVDRDQERFDTEALPVLARMFVGKSGIVDHQWSAKQQVARIFEAGVVTEGGVSYIKAWAYIRRGGRDQKGGFRGLRHGQKRLPGLRAGIRDLRPSEGKCL